MKNIILETFKKLLVLNSKSDDINAVNDTSQYILSQLKDLELDWQSYLEPDAANFLVAKTKIMNPVLPVIVLSAHIDVVYNSSELEVNTTKDKIYGSGASDMKASLIVIIEVLKRLQKDNELKNIILTLSPEEELATPHYREVIKKISKQADYILVFESTKTLKVDPLKSRSIVLSRRGFQGFELNIRGPGGHSGVIFQKDERKSTILKMAEFILKVEKLADYQKMTTLNSGVVNAGKAYNIIAPNAQVIFEARFKVEEERIRILKGLNKIIMKLSKNSFLNFNLKQDKFFPAMYKSERSDGLIKICKEVAQKWNLNLISEERGGGAESSLFQYFNPNAAVLDGFGVHGEGEHTVNEFVFIESIFSTIEFDLDVIRSILKLNKTKIS